MPVFPITKGTMHYDLHGPEGAPWVVVLPGALTAPWLYHPLRDALAPEARVLTVDYRGVGESRNDLWGVVTPAQLAEDVGGLLDHLGVEECHVAGFSLGAFVLAELLHADPSRFGRCAVGGMPALRGRFAPPEQPEMDPDMLEAVAGDVTRLRPLQQVMLGMLPGIVLSRRFERAQPERYKATLRHWLDLRGEDIWVGMQQFYGIFGHDWRRLQVFEGLPRERRLFLSGELDGFAPAKEVAVHPALGDGPTVVFEGTGHLFFYEFHEDTNAVLRSFLLHGRLPGQLPEKTQLLGVPA